MLSITYISIASLIKKSICNTFIDNIKNKHLNENMEFNGLYEFAVLFYTITTLWMVLCTTTLKWLFYSYL